MEADTHTHLLCNTVRILGPKKAPLADVSMQTSDLSAEGPRAVHVYALCQTVHAHTVRVYPSEFPPLDMHNYVQKKVPNKWCFFLDILPATTVVFSAVKLKLFAITLACRFLSWRPY